MKRLFGTMAIAIIVGACGQATDTGTPFSSRHADWQAAMNAGDPDGIAALYASDARLMPPNSEATIGHDAIKEMFGAMIEAGLAIELSPIETHSAGDTAYNVGTYTLTANGDVTDRGKYIEVWRRGADGAWLMTNDIWNSDMPVAMPGGGGDRTHVIALHEVEDFDRWVAAWRGEDSRHDMFKAHGVHHAHTMQSATNPNLTAVILSIGDLEAFSAFLESEGIAEAAASDGVDLASTTFFHQVD